MSDAIGGGMPGISGAGAILSGVMPYPTPHVPPFPTPTLVQPVAQLRQPYIVTLTNQVSSCNGNNTNYCAPPVHYLDMTDVLH